jgi:hypothetical protein
MNSVWAVKVKVPMVTDYNEAISDSMKVSGLLSSLTLGWFVVALLGTLGL